jgi:hypothetical protein
MTARSTALALALLLLAAGAFAAPDACCIPNGSAEPTIRAVDCCETMLEAPTLPQAALAAAVAGLRSLPADSSLPVDLAPVSGLPRLSVARACLGAPSDRPPLYRLHAQLLI